LYRSLRTRAFSNLGQFCYLIDDHCYKISGYCFEELKFPFQILAISGFIVAFGHFIGPYILKKLENDRMGSDPC